VSQSTSILVIGDGPEVSRLQRRLARHFLTVERARTIDESRELAQRCRFHVVVVADPQEPWQALQRAVEDCDDLPPDIVFIADGSAAEAAVEALRRGAADVLLRPFSTEDLVAAVNAVCGKRGVRPGDPKPVQAGNIEPEGELRALIGSIAPFDATLFIRGGAGTGTNRDDIPAEAQPGGNRQRPGIRGYPLDWTLEQVKRHHMARVLAASDGNKSAAARRLDISRKTLDRKLGAPRRE
jgi:DNA-binding NtrC family response regulator